MVKCKIVLDDPTESLCGKDICCHYCDELDTCKQSCESVACKEMLEVPDELQIMETAVPEKIREVTDLMLMVKKAEERITEIKEALLDAMEKNNIKKFENEKVSFTYVAPSTRSTFDKKALQKDHPELDLTKYNKTSAVKASVRIQVK